MKLLFFSLGTLFRGQDSSNPAAEIVLIIIRIIVRILWIIIIIIINLKCSFNWSPQLGKENSSSRKFVKYQHSICPVVDNKDDKNEGNFSLFPSHFPIPRRILPTIRIMVAFINTRIPSFFLHFTAFNLRRQIPKTGRMSS